MQKKVKMSYSDKDSEQVTEEPAPGWLRIEKEGSKPWYKSPVPRTVIRTTRMLQDYLDNEHKQKRQLEVSVNQFSFKRRLGIRKKSHESENTSKLVSDDADMPTSDKVNCADQVEVSVPNDSVVDRLVRSSEVLDHKKLLCGISKKMDSFRLNDGYSNPECFETLKTRLSSSRDFREMLVELTKEVEVRDALDLMFSDECLSEVSRIETNRGPLVDFPNSINHNIYCEVVDYAMRVCPRLFLFVVNMVSCIIGALTA